MAEWRTTVAAVACMCGLLLPAGAALADDEPQPDMELLEYLGSWEGPDEDWVILAAEAVQQVLDEDAADDAALAAEDAVESDDEP